MAMDAVSHPLTASSMATLQLSASSRAEPGSVVASYLSSSHIVQDRPSSATDDVDSIPTNEFAPAPLDGGFQAWSFLAAAFIIEGVIWGFPSSFGVFLQAYLNDPLYNQQKNATALLPLIGPICSGTMYCAGPFINSVITRYPYYRRPLMWLSALICWSSLFGASYTINVKLLVFLQGALYAIGGALVYFCCVSYLSEWFVRRRGLALGIMFAGGAFGGLVLPLLLPHLISSYGPPKSLRILSIGIALCIVVALPFVKGRFPNRSGVRGPSPRGRSEAHVMHWLKSTTFWILILANTTQGFAYFVPIVWLPTFATSIQTSTTNASIALALLNGATFVSQLSMGYLSDRMNPWLIGLWSLLFCSLSTFILWGVLSSSFAGLIAFGIAYGVLAGGWSSLWTGFARPLTKDDPILSTILMGYLGLSRGIGNIFSTPISTALTTSHHPNNISLGVGDEAGFHTGFDVDNGRYKKMIVYVGTVFAGAALASLMGWVVEVVKRRRDRDDRQASMEMSRLGS